MSTFKAYVTNLANVSLANAEVWDRGRVVKTTEK